MAEEHQAGPAQEEPGKETPEGGSRETPVVSLGALWKRVKALPLPEKCFLWGMGVFLLGTILPWTGEGANAWGISGLLGFLQFFGNLAALAALILHLAALAGLASSLFDRFLGLYRFALPAAWLLTLLLVLTQATSGALGAWIGLLSLSIHAWGLYHLLDARNLLPFRITR